MSEDDVLMRLSTLRPSLSGNSLAILEYILERPGEAALIDAAELGRRVGVSASTIVRFAKRVGFSGYPDLQKRLQEILREHLAPMKKLRQSVQDVDESGNLLSRLIGLSAESLSGVYNESLEKAFSAATDALCDASRLPIVGMRSSYSVAYYLSFMLGQFMANTRLVCSGTEDAFDQILDIGTGDVLFAVSFPRYTSRTVSLARYAKGSGARVVALTDTMASPLVPFSDIALLTPNLSPFYSFVGPMALADALVLAVGKRFRDRVQASLDKRERVLIENGVYV